MSCRQLSPRIAPAILLALLLSLLAALLGTPPASAAATVQAVSVGTDRTDYVNVPGFNVVTATATIDFNGNGPLDFVRFEWRAPGGARTLQVHYVSTRTVQPGVATAADAWTADQEGIGFSVVGAINYTIGSPNPVLSPPAMFNVYNRSRFVTVTDIVVVTSAVYENGTLATARADLKYAGNASLLGGVRFDWYYPDWTLVSSTADPSPQPVSAELAQAWSTWSIDRSGPAFHVNATYLSDTSVTNTTSFDVLDRRVANWLPAGNIGPGRTTLDRARSPWGICFNVSVDLGGELYIEPGVVVRFCRGTGVFVNGTLTVDAPPTDRVYLLSDVPVGVPMQAGDWGGITFFPVAPSNRSILSNVVMQAVTDGLRIRGTSVWVLNNTITLVSGSAVWLTNSASLVGNNAISQADIGVRVDGSAGAILDSNRIRGTRRGVSLADSDIVLHANDISLNQNAGLWAEDSRVSVEGGTFRDDGDMGVYLSRVREAHIEGVVFSGSNDSLRGENSQGIVVELSTLAGARYRSVYFNTVSSTFVNCTLAALQWDLVLVASPTTLVNTTTTAPYIQVNSLITVRNFLHVLVESNLPGMYRVANAWANVTSNTITVSSRRTNAAGWSPWVLVTDRVILDPTRTQYVSTVVDVRMDGFSVVSSPRAVNMSTSHVERFLVVPTNSNPAQFFLGWDAMLLITIAVVMGTVLIVMPVMRRRNHANGNGRGRWSPGVALEPGTSYVLPDEKPDRAFDIFGSSVAKGAKGLVVSRIYPDEARRRYGLKDVPVLWLSRGYGKETVNPTNLGALVHEVERFMSGKEDSVVLLDGLEYLLVQNEPQKIVKFVQALADTAAVHRAKVLIPFNAKSVTESQAALLTRDLEPL